MSTTNKIIPGVLKTLPLIQVNSLHDESEKESSDCFHQIEVLFLLHYFLTEDRKEMEMNQLFFQKEMTLEMMQVHFHHGYLSRFLGLTD